MDEVDFLALKLCEKAQFNFTDFNRTNPLCANINFPMEMEDILLQKLQHFLSGIAGLVICILGCIGNGLSLVILKDKMYTSSTNVYLMALAASDSFLLVFAMLLSLNDVTGFGASGNVNLQAYISLYVPPIVVTFQTISIWLVLAFTVDRYIMICHPFQGAKFCNRKRAVVVVACLYVCGFLYNIPGFLERSAEVQMRDGQKYVQLELTKFGLSKFYLEVVNLWGYLIFIVVLPCLTLGVLNFQLIVTVKKSKTKGRRLSLGTTCNHRNDTTLMLVAVVVVFLICQMPALISRTVWASIPDKKLMGITRYYYLSIILEISNFFVILNSAINILLYYVFSPKFRDAFISKFCRPFLSRSKSLFTNFSRQVSRRSTTTTTSTNLSANGTAIDLVKPLSCREARSCESPTLDKRSSAEEATGFTRHSTAVSFNTFLSCEGSTLVAPNTATQLLHCNVHADFDNISQCSSDSVASGPIYV